VLHFLAKEHKTKRRHVSNAFSFVRQPVVTTFEQRLKDLSDIDEYHDGLVRVAMQKRKVFALDAPALKKAKKAQPIDEPQVSIIPSIFPW